MMSLPPTLVRSSCLHSNISQQTLYRLLLRTHDFRVRIRMPTPLRQPALVTANPGVYYQGGLPWFYSYFTASGKLRHHPSTNRCLWSSYLTLTLGRTI